MVLCTIRSSVRKRQISIVFLFYLQQISYSSTSPELSDKKNYPYFYRTIPDDTSLNEPRIALLKTFKWSHVGTIFQEEDIHRTVTISAVGHASLRPRKDLRRVEEKFAWGSGTTYQCPTPCRPFDGLCCSRPDTFSRA